MNRFPALGAKSVRHLSKSCRFFSSEAAASSALKIGNNDNNKADRKQNVSSDKQRETHFGFQTVSEEEKEKRVHHVFANVAKKYDLMNDAMSMGVHRLWKDYFVSRQAKPSYEDRVLDVAGGTGDIAFRMSKFMRRSGTPKHPITICDINQNMLDVGEEKANASGFNESDFNWICGDAESLPFDDNSFDLYTIAFGIRNCTHIDKVLKDAHRVLKPGGRFMCLEFSKVENPVISTLYSLYSFQVIPVMGLLIAGDWNSYQYLVESIRQFPSQREFGRMIQEAGFEKVFYENITTGVVAIHGGVKK